MKSFARGFTKLSNCIYQTQLAARRAVQNCNRNFSYQHSYSSTSLNQRSSLLKAAYRIPCVNRSAYHSESDTDLLGFLKEEVSFEEENIKKVPKIKNFKIGMEGTNVTLTRDFHGEKVVVEFDINDNVNVDDGESMQDDPSLPEEEEDIPDIVSYPTFTVSITKQSGNTLLFNCNCNTGINENDEVDDDDGGEEQYDLLRFDSVQVFNPDEVDKEKAYSAESENMDGELYSMLLNTLLERGVDGTFVNDLVDLSTSAEHRHYLSFLKSLSKFVKEK